MRPFYLSFPNEATGRAALIEARLMFVFDFGDGPMQAPVRDLLILGRKRKPPVWADGADRERDAPRERSVLLDEWRCNLLAERLPASLERYETHPVTPDVVFAGYE